ncbi:ATP-dependent RNA helicase eIF4A [Durusdinium trenchii]|uniref:ATP-dependent RNA helicase eIF4A n=1 Tax=Durusdinium trenchii TaxID=1381693 RepID=A0ABP0NDT1_9DINO
MEVKLDQFDLLGCLEEEEVQLLLEAQESDATIAELLTQIEQLYKGVDRERKALHEDSYQEDNGSLLCEEQMKWQEVVFGSKRGTVLKDLQQCNNLKRDIAVASKLIRAMESVPCETLLESAQRERQDGQRYWESQGEHLALSSSGQTGNQEDFGVRPLECQAGTQGANTVQEVETHTGHGVNGLEQPSHPLGSEEASPNEQRETDQNQCSDAAGDGDGPEGFQIPVIEIKMPGAQAAKGKGKGKCKGPPMPTCKAMAKSEVKKHEAKKNLVTLHWKALPKAAELDSAAKMSSNDPLLQSCRDLLCIAKGSPPSADKDMASHMTITEALAGAFQANQACEDMPDSMNEVYFKRREAAVQFAPGDANKNSILDEKHCRMLGILMGKYRMKNKGLGMKCEVCVDMNRTDESVSAAIYSRGGNVLENFAGDCAANFAAIGQAPVAWNLQLLAGCNNIEVNEKHGLKTLCTSAPRGAQQQLCAREKEVCEFSRALFGKVDATPPDQRAERNPTRRVQRTECNAPSATRRVQRTERNAPSATSAHRVHRSAPSECSAAHRVQRAECSAPSASQRTECNPEGNALSATHRVQSAECNAPAPSATQRTECNAVHECSAPSAARRVHRSAPSATPRVQRAECNAPSATHRVQRTGTECNAAHRVQRGHGTECNAPSAAHRVQRSAPSVNEKWEELEIMTEAFDHLPEVDAEPLAKRRRKDAKVEEGEPSEKAQYEDGKAKKEEPKEKAQDEDGKVEGAEPEEKAEDEDGKVEGAKLKERAQAQDEELSKPQRKRRLPWKVSLAKKDGKAEAAEPKEKAQDEDGKVEGAEPEEKAEDEATTGPAVVGSFRCQDYISSVSLPPPDQLARGRAFGQCAASASEDEDGEASEVFWEPHEANTEVDIAEHPLALRPRGKHTSKEWAQAVQEGWVDKLPYVKGTTLARYSKNLAWSTKYPTEDGMRHFLRSFPAQRTPFVALLQCMEWLVQQHYRKCGTHLSLTAELRDRLKMEKDCFHPLCDCCPGCFSFNTEMS